MAGRSVREKTSLGLKLARSSVGLSLGAFCLWVARSLGDVARTYVVGIGYYHDTFPIQAVWASGVFMVLGGGTRVLYAVLSSVVVDICSPSKRYISISVTIGIAPWKINALIPSA